jgi:hypothetical protein
MRSVHEEDTHIVVPHQDGHGTYDRLQWKAQIGGFLGGLYDHPGYSICRLSDRVRSLRGSTIAGRATATAGCGADGESDSG